MAHNHIDARACRALWLAVLETALNDLAAPRNSSAAETVRRQAAAWFARGPDMLTVAALAGLDGHLIRQRYLAGQIAPLIRQGPKRAA